MGAALDGDAMASAFEKALGDVTMRACSPYYVKYKPERYARVQYRLEFVDHSGRRVRTAAHVALYPSQRADKLAARHGLGEPGGVDARTHAVYLKRLHGLASLFPVDLGLPGLATAAAPEAMARLFSRSLPDVLGGSHRRCRAELVRYKAGKRAVLRYDVAGAAVRTLYGKLRKDGGLSLTAAGTALRRAGVPTPETLAWLPEIGMTVQTEAVGARLAGLRHTSEYAGWMPDVAETLAHLHSVRVDGLPRWSPLAEAAEVQDAARTVAALVPHVGALATSSARKVAAILPSLDAEITTTHGSFHDDQVLVSEHGVTLIDTDSATLGNPMSDVGHFLSYLSAEDAGDAYDRFLDRYLAARGPTRGDHLIFEAASMLRWATLPFREQRPDWPEAVERRVRRAAILLEPLPRRTH